MNIIKANISVLTELNDLINHLDKKQYACQLDIFSGSTIGMHVRHIVEFYLCLLAQHDSGTVSYDQRDRNPELANNPDYASAVIEDLLLRLEKAYVDKELTLVGSLDDNLNENIVLKTNLGRELFYNLEHAIHHMALIKIGVFVLDPSIPMSESFGVAPSTLKYKKQKELLN